jgi:LemA protein
MGTGSLNVYQRRLDLIPNLVNTVKGVANFEKETLEITLCVHAPVQMLTWDHQGRCSKLSLKIKAAGFTMASSFSRLIVVAEQYPQLKATQNFSLELQSSSKEQKIRIAVESQKFNDIVRDYNNLYP